MCIEASQDEQDGDGIQVNVPIFKFIICARCHFGSSPEAARLRNRTLANEAGCGLSVYRGSHSGSCNAASEQAHL